MTSNVGLSADGAYAKRRKQLLAFIKQLRAIGAQADLDLPRICVIGNQSAGKSSLVEAISGITVPRDAGTCTRCPIECRLSSSSGSWTCQISIRWEYDPRGRQLANVEEKPFGPPIKNKAEVELALRRAQAAVLNSAIPTETFLSLTAEQLSNGSFKDVDDRPAMPFSKNAVCIDLSGPELVDLSFVDLPGIIQNADPQTVNLVEHLVRSHIKGNCIILVTLPMNDDIENQKAMRLAKEEDPHGIRTIGVMTKPDTLPAGATKARELWFDILAGHRHPLKHGYFCTRQPDDLERSSGITPSEARDAEMHFFEHTPPWSTSTLQHRLGTDKLVETLSRLLTSVIDTILPKLRQEVADQLKQCIVDLRAFPPAVTTEPTSHVLGIITAFCNEVHGHVKGFPGASSLVQANHKVYEHYKREIRSTAPQFVASPSRSHIPFAAGAKQYTITIDVDEDDKGDSPGVATPPDVQEFIYLDDVRHRIQNSVARELPNNVPYTAKLQLIASFQESWAAHSEVCFEGVHKNFKDLVEKIVDVKLSRYENLKAMFKSILPPFFKKYHDETSSNITMLLRFESTPYTQNSHYLQEKRDKILARYKNIRAGKSVIGATNETPFVFGDQKPKSKSKPSEIPQQSQDVDEALAALSKIGYHVKISDLGKLNPPDTYEVELEVMADVQAYFHVAYKRLIDYVPLSIDHSLLYAFTDALQDYLIKQLELGKPDSVTRCTAYLEEDPSIVANRNELQNKQKRLEVVQKQLLSFALL